MSMKETRKIRHFQDVLVLSGGILLCSEETLPTTKRSFQHSVLNNLCVMMWSTS